MAAVFVPSYALGADGTSLHCRLTFHGSDLQANPTSAHVTVTANAVILLPLAKG